MSTPLHAAARRTGRNEGRPIIDAHVHLWQLPRNAPPMSDDATYPTGCCGSAPWMEVDRMPRDYDARVGGSSVDKLVLIESSVGVPADKIMQSNLWMLQAAAADQKILSVIGHLDVAQSTDDFERQLNQLAVHRPFVGLRIGGGIFQAGVPRSFSAILPNVIPNLTMLAKRGLVVDALGIPGAVLAQVGAAVPGLRMVMDHFPASRPPSTWRKHGSRTCVPRPFIPAYTSKFRMYINFAARRSRVSPLALPSSNPSPIHLRTCRRSSSSGKRSARTG